MLAHHFLQDCQPTGVIRLTGGMKPLTRYKLQHWLLWTIWVFLSLRTLNCKPASCFYPFTKLSDHFGMHCVQLRKDPRGPHWHCYLKSRSSIQLWSGSFSPKNAIIAFWERFSQNQPEMATKQDEARRGELGTRRGELRGCLVLNRLTCQNIWHSGCNSSLVQ